MRNENVQLASLRHVVAYAIAAALMLVAIAAHAQNFPPYVDGSPPATTPLSSTDMIPVIQGPGPPGAGYPQRFTAKLPGNQIGQFAPTAYTGTLSVNNPSFCGQELDLGGAATFTATVSAASIFPAGCQIRIVNTDTANGKALSIPGVAMFYQTTLFPLQAIVIRSDGASWVAVQRPGPYQVPFQTTVQLYVNPSATGCSGAPCSDSNDGLTTATAKASSLGAVMQAVTAYEYSCGPAGVSSSAQINLLSNEPSSAPAVHLGSVGTRGMCAGGTITYDGGNNTTEANWQFFFAYIMAFQNVTIKSTTTTCMALFDSQVRFAGGVVVNCLNGLVAANENSDVVVNGIMHITAGTYAQEWTIAGGSHLTLAATVTYDGNVTYTAADIVGASAASIDTTSATFVLGGHTVTGPKAIVSTNATLATATGAPNTDLPGTGNVQCFSGARAETACSDVQQVGVAFASLPPVVPGAMAYINDGKASNCGDTSCTTFGTTITGGGGALQLLAWYNGANWTLVGK